MPTASDRSWRPTVPVRNDRGPGGSFYPLKFGVAAIFLVSATLVLVLVVLPRRYVLSSGFRESGMNFPVNATPVSTGTLVQRAAPPPPRPLPEVDTTVREGPAEAFWNRVLPLLEEGRYEEALALFREYLGNYPGDRGVRREYAQTLFRAGYGDEAVAELASLLRTADEAEVRLLRARMLRDIGRVGEASTEYATLRSQGIMDSGLALEWAQALAWAERYDEAAEVLAWALSNDPDNASLKVELARVYYASGRLEEARAILSTLDAATLRRLDALRLRDDVDAALASGPEDTPVPPTMLERAASARAAGDLEEADRLYRAILESNPDDRAAWQAYADLLEYDARDFAGALAALREVERLGGADAATQFRMAQLEVWNGETPSAQDRLKAILAQIQEEGPIVLPPVEGTSRLLTASRVEAILGDLARWEGDRDEAARRYEAALDSEPGNRQASEGLVALRRDVDVAIFEAEGPHVGSRGSTLRDTDEFLMADLGAEWLGAERDWVWSVFAGNRWLEGYDAQGAVASPSGLFAQAEGGRWWRWGTIRTAVQLGVESVRSGETDLSVGASAFFTDLGSYTLEAAVRHGPAYGRTATLQAAYADVTHDELRLTVTNQLSPLWSLWAEGRLGRLETGALPGGDSGSLRYEGALAVGRALAPGITLGISAQALGFRDPAPDAGPRRMWWDPRLVLTAGPYARIERELDRVWTVTGRLSAGVAFMDERPTDGFSRVPQLSGDTGLRMRLDRFTTALEVFYLQTRFQGYHSWGARISFGLLDVLGEGDGS
jgi:tetratricopeptide (TPR) repeat protein